MKPLSPKMADRAQAALTYVLDRVEREEPQAILDGLIAEHGGKLSFSCGTNIFRCAGIVTNNTADNAEWLLNGWRRRAVVRLSTFI